MQKKTDEEIFKEIDDLFNEANNVLGPQKEFEAALDMFQKAYRLALKYRYEKGQAKILLGIGKIHNDEGENRLAIEYYQQALVLYEKLGFNQSIRVLNMNIGVAYGNLGLYDKALDYLFKALEIAEKLWNDEPVPERKVIHLTAVANTNLNIGTIYSNMKFVERALPYFEKALELGQQAGLPQIIAISINNLAVQYERAQNFDKALEYYKQSLEIAKESNILSQITRAMFNIATIYGLLKQYDVAKQYYKDAIEHSNESKEMILRASAMLGLVEIYIQEEMHDEAEELLTEIEDIIDLEDNTEVYAKYLLAYMNISVSREDYKNAFEFQKKIIDYDKRIFNEETMKKIASIEADFEIKEKEKEAEIYRLKNVELVQVNDQLQQLHESKDSIMRIVSHDLKNLIGTTSQVIEMVRYQPLSEKVAKYIDTIDTSTKRAIQLVKDILEANEIETENYKLELTPHKLDEYLSGMVGLFTPACEPKNIDFITEFTAGDVVVELHPDKMWQILNNLIHNAIKFTPKEGKVYLKTELSDNPHLQGGIKGGAILIKIIDTGIGIPEEHIPILFEKFTKAKRKGTEGEQTTGIGLSIVKRLVELHNGEITVSSEIGKGTEFCISLPYIV